MRTPGVASVLALTALLCAACNGGPDMPSASGIEGQALVGPACPVVRQDTPCPDRPIQATVVVWDAGRTRRVLTFTTAEDGRFRIALPPGEYLLEPQSPGPAGLPAGVPHTVVVPPDTFVRVTIEYDSGIR